MAEHQEGEHLEGALKAVVLVEVHQEEVPLVQVGVVEEGQVEQALQEVLEAKAFLLEGEEACCLAGEGVVASHSTMGEAVVF